MFDDFVSDESPDYDPESATVGRAREYLHIAGKYILSEELEDMRIDALKTLSEYGEHQSPVQDYEIVSGQEAENYLELELNQVSSMHDEVGGLEDELKALEEVTQTFKEVRDKLRSRNLENKVRELSS